MKITSLEALALTGTPLYQRALDENRQWPDRMALMESEWSPTPFMIDVMTENRYTEIRCWCNKAFGRESSPMHGQQGVWKCGSVTMRGRTWFGFASEQLMHRFESQWRSRAIAEIKIHENNPT